MLDRAERTKAMVAWEYKEKTVYLNIRGVKPPAGGVDQNGAVRQAAINAGSRANPVILRALQEEGASGWQPDGPTDLFSLLLAGQVRWKQSGGFLLTWKFDFEYANVRLKRVTQ